MCALSPKGCEGSANYGGAGNHRDPGVWEWATYMTRFGGEAKCNDVTNLWNCSNDKTQAYRCANSKVEVDQCTAGCQPQANGVDDLCNKIVQSAGDSSRRETVTASFPSARGAGW